MGVFRCRIIAGLIAALTAGASAADEAEQIFQSLYGRQFRDAKATPTKTDDVALAKELLAAARQAAAPPRRPAATSRPASSRPATAPASRPATAPATAPSGPSASALALLAVLCRHAHELGVTHPDGYRAAIDAMELLADHAPGRESACRRKLIDAYRLVYARSRGGRRLEVGETLVGLLLEAAEDVADAGRFDEAISLGGRAGRIAGAVRSTSAAEVGHAMRRYRLLSAVAEKIGVLKAKLAADAWDYAARNELIRLYLVERDDPAAARALLTADADEAYRTYVPLAAGPVEKLPVGVGAELAAWYRSLAAGADEVGQAVVLERARTYYRRYLAVQAPGTSAYLVAKLALQEVEKELRKLYANQPGARALLKHAVLVMTFDRPTFFQRRGRTGVRDLSGQRTHGAVFGATVVEGVAGQALAFDGVDDYVALGNPLALRTIGSQTIAMWIWPTALDQQRSPFGKAWGGEGAITLEAAGTASYFYGISGTHAAPYMTFAMGRPVPGRKWTHLAVVRDLRRGRLLWYRNGVQAARAKAKYPRARPSALAAKIGRGYPAPFVGKIDEFAIFARALTPREVLRLYRLGQAGRSLAQ